MSADGECRREFEKWCVDVAGYSAGEVATRVLGTDNYMSAIQSDWITWQAAWGRAGADALLPAVVGATLAYACSLAAQGVDIRQVEMPQMLADIEGCLKELMPEALRAGGEEG